MKTTLNEIRKHSPCTDGWQKLLTHLGKTQADDEPLGIATIIDSNGLFDALWCLRAVAGHDREIRLYACWCARQVWHLLTDGRNRSAIEVAERFANGEATAKEMDAAAYAAYVAYATDVAYATRRHAANSARSVASVAYASNAADAAYAARRHAANSARSVASVAYASNAADAASAAAASAASAAASAASAAASAARHAADAAYAAYVADVAEAQSSELQRICAAIDAWQDPYPRKGAEEAKK